MRKPQIVKITWYPYPGVKPTYYGTYLVSDRWNSGFDDWIDGDWEGEISVIAWAEMPEGYKEE